MKIWNKRRSKKMSETKLFDDEQWGFIKKHFNLTQRELKIAELVLQGLNYKKIAEILNISPYTVKTHTRNIYRKIGVNNKILMLLKFKQYVDSTR